MLMVGQIRPLEAALAFVVQRPEPVELLEDTVEVVVDMAVEPAAAQ